MIHFFMSGGIVMWPLAAVALGLLGIAAVAAVRLWRGTDPDESARSLHGILFWGAIGLLLGVLGTVMGLVVMADASARAGGAEPGLLWGGVGLSLVSLVFGLILFISAAMLWFALRFWHTRRFRA